MEGIYEVTLQGHVVGQVQVRKEGLYYRFRCQCALAGDVCKLVVSSGQLQESLGILVPNGETFGIDTKLPIKKLGQGKPEFTVEPNKPVIAGKFVPIYPEEPFSYIEKLKNAYLARQNGQLGILIQEKAGT